MTRGMDWAVALGIVGVFGVIYWHSVKTAARAEADAKALSLMRTYLSSQSPATIQAVGTSTNLSADMPW